MLVNYPTPVTSGPYQDALLDEIKKNNLIRLKCNVIKTPPKEVAETKTDYVDNGYSESPTGLKTQFYKPRTLTYYRLVDQPYTCANCKKTMSRNNILAPKLTVTTKGRRVRIEFESDEPSMSETPCYNWENKKVQHANHALEEIISQYDGYTFISWPKVLTALWDIASKLDIAEYGSGDWNWEGLDITEVEKKKEKGTEWGCLVQ